MRKTLIALAAATGLVGFGTVGASAAPIPPAHMPAQTANTRLADWYSGPRGDWRYREWREHHPYHGYNHGYNSGYNRGHSNGYNRGYGYNGHYYR